MSAYVKQARTFYLFKAIDNILRFKSTVQSITVVTQVLESISEDQQEIKVQQEE